MLKWRFGQEFHFTVKKTAEWKSWMQLCAPYPAPRSPISFFAIGNNAVNTFSGLKEKKNLFPDYC